MRAGLLLADLPQALFGAFGHVLIGALNGLFEQPDRLGRVVARQVEICQLCRRQQVAGILGDDLLKFVQGLVAEIDLQQQIRQIAAEAAIGWIQVERAAELRRIGIAVGQVVPGGFGNADVG